MKVGVLFGIMVFGVMAPLRGQSSPLIDHHQHLFGPGAVALAPGLTPVSAEDLVKLLDAAGIERAAVFSIAYQFSNPNRPALSDEYAKVRAENDWTSQEVARFPNRLRGFCSVNPLREYALAEVARCGKDPQLHFGLKLHFGNSDVDLATLNTSQQFGPRRPVVTPRRVAC